MPNENWFSSDFEDITDQIDHDKQAADQAMGDQIFRFFMRDGETKQYTFVAGPFRILEWNFFHNGTWNNYETSIGPNDPLLKALNGKPYPAYIWLGIDHSRFESAKTGKVYEHTMKWFVAKPQTASLLKAQHVKRQGLLGCKFEIMRNGKQAPRVGNQFDFEFKKTIKELREKYPQIPEEIHDDMTPSEIAEFFMPHFAPKDIEELNRLAKELQGAAASDDDDIPF